MIKDIPVIVDDPERARPIVKEPVAMAKARNADLTIEILSPCPVLMPVLMPLTTPYAPGLERGRDEASPMKSIFELTASSTETNKILTLHDDLRALAYRIDRTWRDAAQILVGNANLPEIPRLHELGFLGITRSPVERPCLPLSMCW